jgi:hypothetical protein
MSCLLCAVKDPSQQHSIAHHAKQMTLQNKEYSVISGTNSLIAVGSVPLSPYTLSTLLDFILLIIECLPLCQEYSYIRVHMYIIIIIKALHIVRVGTEGSWTKLEFLIGKLLSEY